MRYVFVVLLLMLPTQALSVEWTHQQKLRLGIIEDKQMVTCRLATKKIIRNQKICIFSGANNTTDTIFIDRFEYCPKQIKCVYRPDQEKPNILEMMESLEKSLKKR